MAAYGRKVLITGGGRGLGRAIAERLAARGDHVGLVARTKTDLEQAVRAIEREGGTATIHSADVCDGNAIAHAVTQFAECAGGIDQVVCAAGQLTAVGPLEGTDLTAWWRDVETTLLGTANTVRAVLPFLRRSTFPALAVLVGPGHQAELAHATGYGTAQAGLVRLVESLAVELAAQGIPIFAVNPGLVQTALVERLIDTPDGRRWLPRFNEAFAEGKEVGADVVAEMVGWLIEHRPVVLSGRVVPAGLAPELLEARLATIAAENRGVLRLR